MANAAKMQEGDVGTLETKRFEVANGLKITLPFEVQTGSVKIKGLTVGETAAAGTFAVKVTPATAEAAGSTEIT